MDGPRIDFPSNQLAQQVPHGSIVLVLGPTNSALRENLVTEKNCKVFDILSELGQDNLHLPAVHSLLDLEQNKLIEIFPDRKFDVIIIYQLLEFLKKPVDFLVAVTSVLSPAGKLLIVVPNVAHASVRLSLLVGRFDSAEGSLLSPGQLQFFSKPTLTGLLSASRLCLCQVERITCGALETDLHLTDQTIITKDLIRSIELSEEGTTYQFIVEAIPCGSANQASLLNSKFLEQDSRLWQCQIDKEAWQNKTEDSIKELHRWQRLEATSLALKDRLDSLELSNSADISFLCKRLAELEAEIFKFVKRLEHIDAAQESFVERMNHMQSAQEDFVARMAHIQTEQAAFVIRMDHMEAAQGDFVARMDRTDSSVGKDIKFLADSALGLQNKIADMKPKTVAETP